VPVGIALSVAVFVVHLFIIERPVHDNRLTLSIAAEEYDLLVPQLINFKNNEKGKGFFISPNFESIADSLISEGERRFELKVSTPNAISAEECSRIYFKKIKLNVSPEVIGNSNFGSSRPLQKSIGIFILLLSFVLLVDCLILQKSQRQIKE